METTKEINYSNLKAKEIILNIIKYLFLILAVLVVLVPLVTVLFAAFKTNTELYSTSVIATPDNWFNFENFKTAWTQGNMATGFKNTLIITGLSLVATILSGTMTAYVLERLEFKGKSLIKFLFLTAALIPSITMTMSTFQIIVAMGLFNTRFAVILLYAGTDIISITLFAQFLKNIPRSIDEAAIIDGASYPRIFFQILLPLLKPAVVTIIIIKGIGFYNDFYTPNLYMKSSNLQTVSTALYAFKGPYGTKWEVICAATIITMIPTIILFVLLQNQIYSGLTTGAVKA